MVRIIDIPFDYELRVQLQYGQEAKVEVLEGNVLSFGFVLPYKKAFTFKNESFALTVVTGQHAKISLTGNVPYYIAKFGIADIVKEPPQGENVILILGAESSGKTMLSKWILNVKQMENSPSIYVNADPAQASIGIPGTIGCVEVTSPITNEGFSYTDPILLPFGRRVIEDEQREVFIDQMREISRLIKEKNNKRKESGKIPFQCVVIDLPMIPPNDESYISLVNEICTFFGVTHILCLGDYKLQKSLSENLPPVNIISLPVQPGAVFIDPESKAKIGSDKIKQYFYGTVDNPLTPVTLRIPIKEFSVNSFGPLLFIPKVMRSSGMDHLNPKVLTSVYVKNLHPGSVVSIIEDKGDPDNAYLQNVIAFYLITKMPSNIKSDEEDFVEVLAPCECELPPHYRIVGSIKLIE